MLIDTITDNICSDKLFMTQMSQQNRYKAIDAIMDKWEELFIPALNRMFHKQRQEVLNNLFDNPPAKAVIIADTMADIVAVVMADMKADMSSNTKAEGDKWLFDENEWFIQSGEIVTHYIRGTLINAGVDTTLELKLGGSFDIFDDRVSGFMDRKIFKMDSESLPVKITTTTTQQLRDTFKAGLEAGESVSEIAKRVNVVFENGIKTRSKLIAQTEIVEAANFGANEAYEQSGVVWGSSWLANLDSRVRDSHASIHGTEAKLGERCSNGLLYPGDQTAGDVGEVARCRCTTEAVFNKPE